MGTDNSLSTRICGSIWAHYAFAVAATLAVLLACHVLNPIVGNTMLYILLLPVIACIAWYCGTAPSGVAVVVSLAGAKYWFITPTHSLRTPDAVQSIWILAFLFASGAVTTMGEARR